MTLCAPVLSHNEILIVDVSALYNAQLHHLLNSNEEDDEEEESFFGSDLARRRLQRNFKKEDRQVHLLVVLSRLSRRMHAAHELHQRNSYLDLLGPGIQTETAQPPAPDIVIYHTQLLSPIPVSNINLVPTPSPSNESSTAPVLNNPENISTTPVTNTPDDFPRANFADRAYTRDTDFLCWMNKLERISNDRAELLSILDSMELNPSKLTRSACIESILQDPSRFSLPGITRVYHVQKINALLSELNKSICRQRGTRAGSGEQVKRDKRKQSCTLTKSQRAKLRKKIGKRKRSSFEN